jgi:hypothetical protein
MSYNWPNTLTSLDGILSYSTRREGPEEFFLGVLLNCIDKGYHDEVREQPLFIKVSRYQRISSASALVTSAREHQEFEKMLVRQVCFSIYPARAVLSSMRLSRDSFRPQLLLT